MGTRIRHLWDSGLFLDLFLIGLLILFRWPTFGSTVSAWMAASPVMAIFVAAVLQILAFAASALLLFAYYNEENAPPSAGGAQSVLYAILLLPVIFGPQWLHLPNDFLIGEEMQRNSGLARSILGIALLGVYAAQITLWIQIASNDERIRSHYSSMYLAPICVPMIGIFLLFAESLIVTSMQHAPASPGIAWWPLGLITLSYLPTRLVLVFRPPFSWLSFGTALTAFGMLLHRLDLLG